MPAEGERRTALRLQALWGMLGQVLEVVEELTGPRRDLDAMREVIELALENLEET